MCLRCVLPKCQMSQRSLPLCPPRLQPSTLPPPLDKPHLPLPSQMTTAPVPLNQSLQEETRSKRDNSDWPSYRNRLEDGNGREGRLKRNNRWVGNAEKLHWRWVKTESQRHKYIGTHCVCLSSGPKLCLCVFCSLKLSMSSWQHFPSPRPASPRRKRGRRKRRRKKSTRKRLEWRNLWRLHRLPCFRLPKRARAVKIQSLQRRTEKSLGRLCRVHKIINVIIALLGGTNQINLSITVRKKELRTVAQACPLRQAQPLSSPQPLSKQKMTLVCMTENRYGLIFYFTVSGLAYLCKCPSINWLVCFPSQMCLEACPVTDASQCHTRRSDNWAWTSTNCLVTSWVVSYT